MHIVLTSAEGRPDLHKHHARQPHPQGLPLVVLVAGPAPVARPLRVRRPQGALARHQDPAPAPAPVPGGGLAVVAALARPQLPGLEGEGLPCDVLPCPAAPVIAPPVPTIRAPAVLA